MFLCFFQLKYLWNKCLSVGSKRLTKQFTAIRFVFWNMPSIYETELCGLRAIHHTDLGKCRCLLG